MRDRSSADFVNRIHEAIDEHHDRGVKNINWLTNYLHPYFLITMQDEPEAFAHLASELQSLEHNRRVIMADRDKLFMLACLNRPGSLYETMRRLDEREISYTEIIHSEKAPPGLSRDIEIHRYEFNRKSNEEITGAGPVSIPGQLAQEAREALEQFYPRFDLSLLDRYLRILWLNNPNYILISPARRLAQVLWAWQQSSVSGGIYLDVEQTADDDGEYRVLFAAANPPQEGFLLQIMEVFRRLEVGISRSYCLNISTGDYPYFIGSFYTRPRDAEAVARGTVSFYRLQQELYNTQVLSVNSTNYQRFVVKEVMAGEDASLVNAFISFCHTNLAHNQPDIYDLQVVKTAFHSHPDIAMQLVKLFKARFNPWMEPERRGRRYEADLEETRSLIAGYSTGNRHLDNARRTVFECCLSFITNTLKTNFFVLEKHALSFRLDPAYLGELDPGLTADLPTSIPFRITYFFGRYGLGYHIGFSDIARGGWRTILARNPDEYTTSTDTLLREVYVLAHTQHLKNKDIYEGGSKMAVVLDAEGVDRPDEVDQRMYKLQLGFTHAFLDIFITEEGTAADDRVVDYYGEDEPIELGPDENMHDSMIENIARLSVSRGYVLGDGIISSKQNGINHKEFGVTSTGVVRFAEITLGQLGTDMSREPFSVNLTGGPDGDVAGNAIRLLLDRCPKVKIRLVLDGSGALYDPEGANRRELRRILFKGDIDAFNPEKLHSGGFILYRSERRTDGFKRLYKKAERLPSGVRNRWVSTDDFHREYGNLIFNVPADLFIPAGGRPETIQDHNWQEVLDGDGQPKVRAIVEGANSFITPQARDELQKNGVVIMRDASANKCGVISSSYEVIANLLTTEKEFSAAKERYVADVLEILEQRAADEANLIFNRYRESGESALFTEITSAISVEINSHYARLFELFKNNPELRSHPLIQKALIRHMPKMVQNSRKLRSRIKEMPDKYQCAIMASEVASSLVYRSSRDTDLIDMVKGHLKRVYEGKKR
jgi:glutamate dehydrogenase